jgi:hypothetical protein
MIAENIIEMYVEGACMAQFEVLSRHAGGIVEKFHE